MEQRVILSLVASLLMLVGCNKVDAKLQIQQDVQTIQPQENASEYEYIGMIDTAIASEDETISGEERQYIIVRLDDPVALKVFFENTETTYHMNKVRVIEVGDQGDIFEKNVHKRVALQFNGDCVKSMSPYVYEDVLCSVKSVRILN